ncbi:zinc finger SWIM domain-containing protein 6-like [Schistocerca piceifrons]|uniref:zinc finger SWIM domain-containing protein 6-like n=1 Tax=Schistocerca piceifrons TaxID=274613 RepID=UPI001F5FE075|nr:zinc finger SWIM domain-containing protein 6-like [Schistocerca piceifrons]
MEGAGAGSGSSKCSPPPRSGAAAAGAAWVGGGGVSRAPQGAPTTPAATAAAAGAADPIYATGHLSRVSLAAGRFSERASPKSSLTHAGGTPNILRELERQAVGGKAGEGAELQGDSCRGARVKWTSGWGRRGGAGTIKRLSRRVARRPSELPTPLTPAAAAAAAALVKNCAH